MGSISESILPVCSALYFPSRFFQFESNHLNDSSTLCTVKMFKRILNFVNNIRINSSFSGYEDNCRAQHIQYCQIKFSTSTLHADRNRIEREIENEADKIFNNGIKIRQQILSGIGSEINSNEKKLSFFLRKYKNELAKAYEDQKMLLSEKSTLIAKLRELKSSLSVAYDGKKGAFDEVEEYQDDIDSWYDKAERGTFFGGNKGLEIPRRSFFGQSMGDLYSSRAGRSEAYDNVDYWRGKIDRLKGERSNIHNRLDAIKLEIGSLGETISQIKSDRDYTFKLREGGHRDHKLKAQLLELRSRLGQENAELRKTEFSRSKFVAEKINSSEISAIGDKIQRISEERARYLSLFDLEENKARRIADHRVAWLNERKKI
jgi:hypothetical protein